MIPLPYIVLFEYIVGVIFEIIGFIFFMLIIAYIFKQKQGFFLSMYFYLFCCLCQSFFGIIHLLYMNYFWKLDTVVYNAYIMYVTGSFATLFLMSNSLCVSFLTIDRILTTLFPIKYSSKIQFATNIAFLIFLITYNITVILLDFVPGFPETTVTQCRALGCMSVKTQFLIYLNTRYCVAAINVALGIILGILLQKHLSLNTFINKTNRLIIGSLIIAFLFDFLPHSAGFVSYEIFNFQLTAVFGPYSLFVGSLDIGICGLLYSKILLKQNIPTTVTVISNQKAAKNEQRYFTSKTI